MFMTRICPAAVAVASCYPVTVTENRLIAVEVLFPDVGTPRAIRLGYLRYQGEPAPQGEVWEVAASHASNHDH